MSEIIAEKSESLAALDFALGMDEAHEIASLERYQEAIDGVLRSRLGSLPISTEQWMTLHSCVIRQLTRTEFPPGSPGIVIAGFGAREHFPALRSARVQARVNGRLKVAQTVSSDITRTKTASIIPFAQRDAATLFIEGIDPAYIQKAHELVADLIEGYTTDLIAVLNPTEEQAELAKGKWEALAIERFQKFVEDGKSARHSMYVEPLVDVVAALPMDELASIAAALVNLTSLRRKVSMDAETVGGPIDVAVISKGDGLVWIQRKHYFAPELNPHFSQNYFRARANDDAQH